MHLKTTATEITRTGYSTEKSSNRSIVLCILRNTCRLWGFLCVRDAGCRCNKITAFFSCLHMLPFCPPNTCINSTVTIVFWQSTVRPFLVDPSSRATEWLKAHLKDQRLEVINQQVLNILYFSLPVSVVVNNSILKVVNKILLIGKWKRGLCCRC